MRMRTACGMRWVPPAHESRLRRVALALCAVLPLCAACVGPAGHGVLQSSTPRLLDFEGFWQTTNATLASVQAELTRGTDLNATNSEGQTPLMLAAGAGKDAAVITALLEAGADPKLADRNGDTALHFAASRNPDPAVITVLVQAGADPNTTHPPEGTVLHVAAGYNPEPAVITALLQAGADPTVTMERMQFGMEIQTVTAEAAKRLALSEPRGAEVVQVIDGSAAEAAGVEKGDVVLSFNGADVSDSPGLVAAIKNAPANQTVTVEVWRAGRLVTLTGLAKTPVRLTPVDRVSRERPALMAALMAGRCGGWNTQAFFSTAIPNAVTGCLARGADPNARDAAGRTPLDWALATGKPGLVRALLATPEIRASADVRVNLRALALSVPASAGERRLQEAVIRQAQQGGAAGLVDEAAVRHHLARGAALVKAANNAAGFVRAAAEFRAAARAAPWVAGAHYNLGVVLEQAGQLPAARDSYRLYLLAAPQAANTAQVEQHIIELEVQAEVVAEARREEQARLEQQQEEERKNAEMVQKLAARKWCEMRNGEECSNLFVVLVVDEGIPTGVQLIAFTYVAPDVSRLANLYACTKYDLTVSGTDVSGTRSEWGQRAISVFETAGRRGTVELYVDIYRRFFKPVPSTTGPSPITGKINADGSRITFDNGTIYGERQ